MVCAEYAVEVFEISCQELANKSLIRSYARAGPLLVTPFTSMKFFVQVCIGSNTPVIILLITTGNTWGGFPRRVSKKHVAINCLILPALLPGQSGGCKNVLRPFFKGRLQVKGGSLIKGWNQLHKLQCPIFGSLLSESVIRSRSRTSSVSTFQAAAWPFGNLNFALFLSLGVLGLQLVS